jgi:hypothetical protein
MGIKKVRGESGRNCFVTSCQTKLDLTRTWKQYCTCIMSTNLKNINTSYKRQLDKDGCRQKLQKTDDEKRIH